MSQVTISEQFMTVKEGVKDKLIAIENYLHETCIIIFTEMESADECDKCCLVKL